MAILIGQPALVRSVEGCLNLFAGADDGQVHTIREVDPGGAWTDWEPLGLPGPAQVVWVTAAPANLIDVTGLVLYAVGVDGQVFETRQVATGKPWAEWSAAGISSAGPVAAVQAFGGIDAAFVISAGTLHERAGGLGWQPYPGPVLAAGPTVGLAADGRVEVFALGVAGNLWHAWQISPGGPWSEWVSHGHPDGTGLELLPPALGASTDGRLELFAVGSDAAVWQLRPSASAPGNRSAWRSHGHPARLPLGARSGLPDSPVLAMAADGRLELFLSGPEGAVYHARQTATGTGTGTGWSPWQSHGVPGDLPGYPGIHPSPVAGAGADGRLELFVIGRDGQLWHRWQTDPGGGWTASWTSHGHP